jgi:hypothetical protein
MPKFKDGDRVLTTKRLYIIGHPDDWMEPGSAGLVIGATKTQNYLIVKLDGVESPTYIRESNLEHRPVGLEDLNFSDGEMTVEFWEGNKRNAPWVRFYVKTYESKYDIDYDEESEIVGDHVMNTLDDMVKLRDFLNAAIDKAKDRS